MKNQKHRIDPQFYFSVGLRLYEARQAKDWTLLQLSKRTGASASALCCYEAGKQVPRIDRLRDICAALDVSADWVLGLKEKEV